MTSSGVQESGEWVPAFAGQREPFAAGNTLSTKHGAFSPRIIGPLAQQIAEDLLADENTPIWLHERSFRYSLMAWARAEAKVLRLTAEQDRLDEIAGDSAVMDDLTDVIVEAVEETRIAPGVLSRSVVTKARESVDKALDRAERSAAARRAELGLGPRDRARLGRDIIGMGQPDMARIWAELAAEDG